MLPSSPPCIHSRNSAGPSRASRMPLRASLAFGRSPAASSRTRQLSRGLTTPTQSLSSSSAAATATAAGPATDWGIHFRDRAQEEFATSSGISFAARVAPPSPEETRRPDAKGVGASSGDQGAWVAAGGSAASGGGGRGDGGEDSYVLNFGTAVRVLREDLPQLLQRPLQWGIYREDIAFITPWSSPLRGIRSYQLMHSVMRTVSWLLYRTATIELLRLWSPAAGTGGGSGFSGGASGSGGGQSQGDGGGGGDGAAETGNSSSSRRSSGGGDKLSGGQLRVRWRATGQPWLPWSDEQRVEVVATYRFDQRGLISAHELTTVIPPEPPLLLWPLLAVAQLLGRMRGSREGGRESMPVPGAGAGAGAGPMSLEEHGGGGGVLMARIPEWG